MYVQFLNLAHFLTEELPHWVLSAMKCLANCKYHFNTRPKTSWETAFLLSVNLYKIPKRPECWLFWFSTAYIQYCGFCFVFSLSGPNGSELKQPMYPGFERDVLKTVADYFHKLKEPLLTFQLYDIFVNILGESLYIIVKVSVIRLYLMYFTYCILCRLGHLLAI